VQRKNLLHNMSVMPTELAIVKPASLETSPWQYALPRALAADPVTLAARLRVTDLRAAIERATERLCLRGCALVRAPRGGETAGRAGLLLSLVVLSKSSDRIFLPAKTPMLDAQTLSRTLVSTDARLRSRP
jgi:hypothetical protein